MSNDLYPSWSVNDKVVSTLSLREQKGILSCKTSQIAEVFECRFYDKYCSITDYMY